MATSQSLIGQLRQRVTALRGRKRRPRQDQEPASRAAPGVRLQIILIVANALVLCLLGLVLYRTGGTLIAPPPLATVVVTATHESDPEPAAQPSATPEPVRADESFTRHPGNGGAIAFVAHHEGNSDIYALSEVTRELVRLTSDPAEDRDPAWSPDGQALAFASRRAGNWDIYLLDLEGGALIRLTHDPGFDAGPAWSPDGSRIAFESYRDGNLDVFVMDADGSNARRLTTEEGPDHSPAWSPDGEMIAFASHRDGNQDLFLYLLQDEDAGRELNLTRSPEADEGDPAWSPQGNQLAYTLVQDGRSAVHASIVGWRTESVTLTETVLRLAPADSLGSVSSPAWAPDGQWVATVQRSGGWSHLVASGLHSWGSSQEIHSAPMPVDDPTWGPMPVSPRAIARVRAMEPESAPPLYSEQVEPTPASGPPYGLVNLPDVNDGDDGEDQLQLSDQVDGSYNALRQRVRDEAGWDYLAVLEQAWLPMDHVPPPGQSRMSWHVCGRAIAIDQGHHEQDEPLIQLVREDVADETFWRTFLRAAKQDGSMGEPLRVAPWNLRARDAGGVAAVQGGELLSEVPAGYFVDLTALAADLGWERVPALFRWRYFWPDIMWWRFQKTDGLQWRECMAELYELGEIETAFGPTLEQAQVEAGTPPPIFVPQAPARPRVTRSPFPFTCQVKRRPPEYEIPWSGVAGHVQDLNGNALPGYFVKVECPSAGIVSLGAGQDVRFNQFYGSAAAWEQACDPTAYREMEIRVQLFNSRPETDGTYKAVSDMLYIELYGNRSTSLGYVTCTLNWQEWR